MQNLKNSKRLQELVQLMQENPELEVIPKVDTELLLDDDFAWMRGEFGRVEIDEYCERNENIYLRSQSEDSVMDDVMDDIFVSEGYKEGDYGNKITEEELEAKARKQIDWKKAIFVRIEP